MTYSQPASAQRFGVALLRVSTDKQYQEGESIENQRRKVEFAARRERIDIVRFFIEHYSGRKSDRRIVDDLFDFLSENRDISTVLVGDIDRFTRGGTEVYLALKRRLSDLSVQLIDTTGIIQPERNRLEHLGVEYAWAMDSPSHYAEVFMAEKARAEAADILTRTIGRQIELTRQGYQVRPANYGYKNVKITDEDGKRKTIMEPDPEEARFVRRIFELRAEGTVTDEQIAQHLNAMGYRSRERRLYDPQTRRVVGRTGGKPICPKQIQRLVRKTIYCGVRLDAWNMGKPVLAPIEPIVSIYLFNRANRGAVAIKKKRDGEISVERNVTTYYSHRHNPEFLLRHVVLCPECRKPLLASRSRGKSGQYFGYYHCRRGHAYCGYAKQEFEETIGKYLDGLTAKPGFLPLFREVVRDVWIRKTRNAKEDRSQVTAHVNALKAKQQDLVEMIPESRSQVVRKRLEEKIEELELTIDEAEAHLLDGGLRENEIDAYFEVAKRMLEHPREAVFSAATKEQIEKSWSFIFTTSPTYAEIADRTPPLTLIYRLNRDFSGSKDQMVAHLVSESNTLESLIRSGLDLDLPGDGMRPEF